MSYFFIVNDLLAHNCNVCKLQFAQFLFVLQQGNRVRFYPLFLQPLQSSTSCTHGVFYRDHFSLWCYTLMNAEASFLSYYLCSNGSLRLVMQGTFSTQDPLFATNYILSFWQCYLIYQQLRVKSFMTASSQRDRSLVTIALGTGFMSNRNTDTHVTLFPRGRSIEGSFRQMVLNEFCVICRGPAVEKIIHVGRFRIFPRLSFSFVSVVVQCPRQHCQQKS